MIIAHLSDLHLGHRAFDRTERGQNIRERDLAIAFTRAMEALVEVAPDLVVIAGDVFDRPDPPPGALVALTRGLEALHSTLPDTRVLMIAGARDTPRRSEDAGALAALDAFPNVDAATGSARTVVLSRYSTQVVLLPYRSAIAEPLPAPEPDPRQRWNIVVAHGRLLQGEGAGVQLEEGRWNYVALGGHHTYREVAPRVVYSGALERVGPSPWDEAAEEKGFVVADLSSGAVDFHPVQGRPVVAMAPTRVPPGDPAALQKRIEEVTREIPGGIDGKIVRIRLRGPRPRDLADLPPGFLAELVDRALHLSVELEEERDAAVRSMMPLRDRVRAELSSTDERTARLLDRVFMPDSREAGG